MRNQFRRWQFLAGFLVASLLFGGITMAADIIQRDIRVSYLPLKYIFDGTEKFPPADQQGFTYNGRTYVPLRFMAESVGKAVEYDPADYSIYVGRRPGVLPDFTRGFTVEGDATVKMEYYETGAQNLRGVMLPNAVLMTALGFPPQPPVPDAPPAPERVTKIVMEYDLDYKFQTLKGTLFVPVHYFGDGQERRVAKLTVRDEYNAALFDGRVMSTTSPENLTFNVPVGSSRKVRLFITLYTDEGVPAGNLVATQVGLSDFQFIPK